MDGIINQKLKVENLKNRNLVNTLKRKNVKNIQNQHQLGFGPDLVP